MKGKNGIVDFSRARVSRKKVSPGRYGGNIAIFFSALSHLLLFIFICLEFFEWSIPHLILLGPTCIQRSEQPPLFELQSKTNKQPSVKDAVIRKSHLDFTQNRPGMVKIDTVLIKVDLVLTISTQYWLTRPNSTIIRRHFGNFYLGFWIKLTSRYWW